MRLAIADPPYPPQFSERRDLADGGTRLTMRSRAVRWYGHLHSEAAAYDGLEVHQALLAHLVQNFDGWAIATTPDGLGAYHPLPVSARVLAWHRPNGMPGGGRLVSRWEPVIVYVPEERRPRTSGEPVSDVLTAASPRIGFAGAKPPEWTRWVLACLGYDPATDVVEDLFAGSGAVSAAADGMLL